MADQPPSRKADPSDLIGVEFTIAVAVAVLVVLGCFFFIGPIVGMIVLIASGLIGGYIVVKAISAADIED